MIDDIALAVVATPRFLELSVLEGSVVFGGVASVMTSSSPAGSVASMVSSNSSSSVLAWFVIDAVADISTSSMG